jgi:hypothetical protein
VLANQKDIVADTYALRVALISHLFIEVLPVPTAPPSRAKVDDLYAKVSVLVLLLNHFLISPPLTIICRHRSVRKHRPSIKQQRVSGRDKRGRLPYKQIYFDSYICSRVILPPHRFRWPSLASLTLVVC